MILKIVLLLLVLYILVISKEGYDNMNDLLIFIELKDSIKKDNIKYKSINLTKERSKYLYNYMFNVNRIVIENINVGDYLNKVEFVKNNNLSNLVIKKINTYYNLEINNSMNINNYVEIIKLNKFNELWYYFDKNLVNKIILNIILNEKIDDKFDKYLINKLLELNLVKYDIVEINKLLEEVNNKLINYVKDKFNKEYSNIVILDLNKIRNLVYIGEINI